MLTNEPTSNNLQLYKTNRFEKGFVFETEIYYSIEQCLHYDYFQHNPIDYSQWLHNVGKGCDEIIVVEGLVFNIECKYLNSNRIYLSYIRRDYIPRFNGKSGYCIVVTNNKWSIPYTCRRLLEEQGIMVWNSYELTYNITTLTNRYLNSLKKDCTSVENNIDAEQDNETKSIGIVSFNFVNKIEHPSTSKLFDESIDHDKSKTNVVKNEQSGEDQLYYSLFQQGSKLIKRIEFEGKNKIKRVRKKLTDEIFLCLSEHKHVFRVKTKQSWLGLRSYLQIYVKNLFNSTLTLSRLLKKRSLPITNIPDILFHGTTTKFFNSIIDEGLLISEAGKCGRDKEKGIWLTDSLYAAEGFALNATDKYAGEPMILLIDISELKNKLKLSYGKNRINYPSVFDYFKRFSVDTSISPEQILDYCIIPKDESLFLLLETIRRYYVEQFLKDRQ